MNDHRSTAIHEAGHAVIRRVCGLECGHVTIVPDEDEGTAGFAIVHDPWITMQAWDDRGHYRDFRSVMIGRIFSHLAGREAEEEIMGTCQGGDGDDRWQVALIVEDIGWKKVTDDNDADRDRFIDRLVMRTRGLVRRHRATIERVAAELLARDTLSPDEVDQAMRI